MSDGKKRKALQTVREKWKLEYPDYTAENLQSKGVGINYHTQEDEDDWGCEYKHNFTVTPGFDATIDEIDRMFSKFRPSASVNVPSGHPALAHGQKKMSKRQMERNKVVYYMDRKSFVWSCRNIAESILGVDMGVGCAFVGDDIAPAECLD